MQAVDNVMGNSAPTRLNFTSSKILCHDEPIHESNHALIHVRFISKRRKRVENCRVVRRTKCEHFSETDTASCLTLSSLVAPCSLVTLDEGLKFPDPDVAGSLVI